MQLKGYEVWISCNGKPLAEYCVQPEGSDGKTIACFVPSECGKSFVIEWRDHVKQSHLRFVTNLDGKEVGGNRCIPGGKGHREGVRTNPTTRKPFKFANLLTTDDEEEVGMTSHEKLGEIMVGVSRIRAEYRSVQRSWNPKFHPTGAVHERSKKAGAHCVTLGEDRRIPTSRIQTRSTPLNPREGDVARFIFRYRPLALLQAQGIVPLPEDVKPVVVKTCPDDFDESSILVSGSRSSRKRRIDALSHEYDSDQDVKPDVSSVAVNDESDLEGMKSQLLAQLHTVERAIKRRKTDGTARVSSTRTRVKTEPRTASLRRRPSERVVIDLTLE
ncbi:hypothetical protein OH76DRAFT_1411128 [Lentinus brumalis]|uniref:DUF7918 domain-containing protein n=1 Tax=Lentinus brumalis TaxID=2498619 RepID=A0A371CQ77_9APHY|nr:hypothetical protein OH76DRAFT_1411128 [Polyporus brumalis]